jgi:hypothetical protein
VTSRRGVARIVALGASVGVLAIGAPGAAAQIAPPPFRLAAGLDQGALPWVKTYDSALALRQSFFAFDPAFGGGVSVALGDVDGDGMLDVVAGAGPGGAPMVKVFSGADGSVLKAFFAYSPAFTGGVRVAAGDVNGDGLADIVTGPGTGGTNVKVFSGLDLSLLKSFLAYPAFGGGVYVAAGDLDGDELADIVTGPTTGSHVKAFSGADLSLLKSFLVFPGAYNGGVTVAVGDVNEDQTQDIVVGTATGVGYVRIFDGLTNTFTKSWFAYPITMRQGIRVAAGDINGDGRADIVTAAGAGLPQPVKIFSGQDTSLLASFFPFDTVFTAGVWVAAGGVALRG